VNHMDILGQICQAAKYNTCTSQGVNTGKSKWHLLNIGQRRQADMSSRVKEWVAVRRGWVQAHPEEVLGSGTPAAPTPTHLWYIPTPSLTPGVLCIACHSAHVLLLITNYFCHNCEKGIASQLTCTHQLLRFCYGIIQRERVCKSNSAYLVKVRMAAGCK
jgi:hypothetical protein